MECNSWKCWKNWRISWLQYGVVGWRGRVEGCLSRIWEVSVTQVGLVGNNKYRCASGWEAEGVEQMLASFNDESLPNCKAIFYRSFSFCSLCDFICSKELLLHFFSMVIQFLSEKFFKSPFFFLWLIAYSFVFLFCYVV